MSGEAVHSADLGPEPPRDCQGCQRLVAFRSSNRTVEPNWFNGAVTSFGAVTARLLIVGLAPGLKGANRTGRPFTGDYAGHLLYGTLLEFGFAKGSYAASPDDGLTLIDCMVTNAVRCVPPQNKPAPSEIAQCRAFLVARISSLPKLRVIVALGRVAHDSTLIGLGVRKSLYPFAHRRRHDVGADLTLFDSLHCSRLNTNTGRLTADMFRAVFADVRAVLDAA